MFIHCRGQSRAALSRRIVPDDAKYCPVFETTRVHPLAEQRKHSRTVYQTRGKPLVMAKGPQQLLMDVLPGILVMLPWPSSSLIKYLNAILGHWNLFKVDWLHCDVSNGNIMLLAEREERDPVPEYVKLMFFVSSPTNIHVIASRTRKISRSARE